MKVSLTEVRKQLLATFPINIQNATIKQWTAELAFWAVVAHAKLEATEPPFRRRKVSVRKPPPISVVSLQLNEVQTIIDLVLKCTDVEQLKLIRTAFFTHWTPIIDRVRSGAAFHRLEKRRLEKKR